MEITWLGHSCFRLRSREGVVVTDPCPPSSGYSIGKPTADIVTISHDHPNHSYRKAVAGKPVVIDAPGEYEVAGIFITGQIDLLHAGYLFNEPDDLGASFVVFTVQSKVNAAVMHGHIRHSIRVTGLEGQICPDTQTQRKLLEPPLGLRCGMVLAALE